MKTIITVRRITSNLLAGLAVQQLLYSIQYNKWIDFTEWSITTLGFELLFLLYIVLSSIVASRVVSVEPITSSKNQKQEDEFENIYFPKEQ